VLGVIGGLAEKFGWEAKPLRILAGLLGVLTLPLGALPVIVPYVTIWAITRTRGVTRPAQPLRRSRDHQVIAGVLAGAAEWLGTSPAVVRTTYAALTVATFGLPGIVTYLIMWAKTPLGGETPSSPHSR
jgi:phage shock protein PspC (stress-responsive transcriptional regulator)